MAGIGKCLLHFIIVLFHERWTLFMSHQYACVCVYDFMASFLLILFVLEWLVSLVGKPKKTWTFITYASEYTLYTRQMKLEGGKTRKLYAFKMFAFVPLCVYHTIYINFTLASFSMRPRQFYSTKYFENKRIHMISKYEHKICTTNRMKYEHLDRQRDRKKRGKS